ncbi:Ig-like domain-containing protein, partial [Alteromonas sp. C1M14]|uniref:Ig-like domain-containing protein n=1 Tax=Alteromonas sp. C1M14 TaxID=2841567 RepID=UPI001C0887EB
NLDALSNLNSAKPIISGTCDEIGAVINIEVTDSDEVTQTFTTDVLPDGTFAIELPADAAEGLLSVDVSVLDSAGNVASVSTTGLIDLTLPVLNLDALSNLNSATPTISGTCDEIGAVINIEVTDSDEVTQTFTTDVLPDGTFAIELPADGAEGLLSVDVSVLDSAGNVATVSTSGLIDLTIPLLSLDNIGLINDATPTISGTSDEIGGTVTLTAIDAEGDEQTLSTTVQSDGTFTTEIPLDVAEGLLDIEASVIDLAGNINTLIETGVGTIDTLAPNLSISHLPSLADPSIQGATDPEMAGRSIQVDVTADILGIETSLSISTNVLVDGSWSTGPIANLSLGPIGVSVSITDEAGNIATVSESSSVSTTDSAPLTDTTAGGDSLANVSITGNNLIDI